MPEQYADDADDDRWRGRYNEALRTLAARLYEAVVEGGAARTGLVRHTAFRLAYHGRDDRALQSLRRDMLIALMQLLAPPMGPSGDHRAADD